MKFLTPIILLALVSFVVANWLPEDYEIFSLNDKVKADLGTDTTFYSWLKLEKGPRSTLDEINKAYRKMSRKMHPDKFSGKSKKEKKRAEERFQRLSLVGNILRDNSLKTRYDYFLKQGFPKWKGTGYFYSRFRPGVALVFLVLFVIVSSFQYVSLRISRKQDHKRIASMKKEILMQAWGGSFVPPLDGSARKVQAANGAEFLVSPIGEVSLLETDKKGEVKATLVDENDINVNPGFRESFFYRIPCGLWNVTLGKLTGRTIDTTVTYVNPNAPKPEAAPEKKKKANAKKGQKIELPNGKVIYSRKKN